MNVTINGEAKEIDEKNLAELCKQYPDHPNFIATAVNGTFVRVHDRGAYELKEGDNIEILSPRQGG